MPTPTYTPLATVTLGTAASSVTFGSIPATYRDLVLVVVAANTSNSNNGIRFNSDSGSNYSRVWMGGNASNVIQSGSATTTSLQFDNYAFTSTTLGSSTQIIQVMDYSATDKHKTALVRANQTFNGVDALAGRWANTAAITSLQVITISGFNFIAGSTFSLYGVIA